MHAPKGEFGASVLLSPLRIVAAVGMLVGGQGAFLAVAYCAESAAGDAFAGQMADYAGGTLFGQAFVVGGTAHIVGVGRNFDFYVGVAFQYLKQGAVKHRALVHILGRYREAAFE